MIIVKRLERMVRPEVKKNMVKRVKVREKETKVNIL